MAVGVFYFFFFFSAPVVYALVLQTYKMVHIIVLVCGYMLSVRADGMASGSGSSYDDDDFAQSAVSNVIAVDGIDTLQPHMYPGCTIKDLKSYTWTDVPMTLQECMSFCTIMQNLLHDKRCGYITFAPNGGADGKGTCTAGSLGWNITATKTISDFFNDDCYEPLSSSGTHVITVLKQQLLSTQPNCRGLDAYSLGTYTIGGSASRFDCLNRCHSNLSCKSFAVRNQVVLPATTTCNLYSRTSMDNLDGSKCTVGLEIDYLDYYAIKFYAWGGAIQIFPFCSAHDDDILGGRPATKPDSQIWTFLSKAKCEAYCNTIDECEGVTINENQCFILSSVKQCPEAYRGTFNDELRMHTTYLKTSFSTNKILSVGETCSAKIGYGIPVVVGCNSPNFITGTKAQFKDESNCGGTGNFNECSVKFDEWLTGTQCCRGKDQCSVFCNDQTTIGTTCSCTANNFHHQKQFEGCQQSFFTISPYCGTNFASATTTAVTATTTALTGDTSEIMPYTFSGCFGTALMKAVQLTKELCFIECTETFNCVAVAYGKSSCLLYSSDTLDELCYDASASTDFTFYTKPYWEYKKSACHHDDKVPDTAVIEVKDDIQLNECVKQCIDKFKDCVGITAEGEGNILDNCFLLNSTKARCNSDSDPIQSKFTLFNLHYFVDSLAIYNCHHDDRNGAPHLIATHSAITLEACAGLCVDNCVGIAFKDADGTADPSTACFLLSSIVPSPKCAKGGIESKYTLYNIDFFSTDVTVTTNIYKGCRGDDTTVIGKVSDGVSDLYSKITKAQCEAFCNAVSACSAITVSNEQCTLHQEVGDMINSPTCDGADTVYYLSSAFTAQTEESLCNSSVKFDDICTPPLPAITIETKDGTTGRVIGIVAGSCVAVVGIYYVGRYIYRKITDESEGASFTQMFQL
jgi:hypothetical protein